MPVAHLTPADVRTAAAEIGLHLSEEDIASYTALMRSNVDAYNVVDALPADVGLPPLSYAQRGPIVRPSKEHNPCGAWFVKCTIPGAKAGPLHGFTVAVKDNILVRGVPMMNGNATLMGANYTPDFDATVVTRLLDAGATILGKAACEDLCLSGGSHTCAAGPVRNPHNENYSSGGSSSGSAVLVSLGEVRAALACDQGGSIRIPSSFSGTYGMKPTFGLVPYTGIMPIEVSIDHVGPITRSVRDNALLLGVLAGVDGYDLSRQSSALPALRMDYTARLHEGVRGLRIGVLLQGFGYPNSDPEVDAKVRAAAGRLAELGASVVDVSIPEHALAPAIWTPIGVEGLTQTMMLGDGYGVGRPDTYALSLMDAHRAGWRADPGAQSESVKLLTMLGVHMRRTYGSHYYGKAANAARHLTSAYDAVLSTQCDLLLMPTTPFPATELPPPHAPREVVIGRALDMAGNTMAGDVTGHPAMAVPCGRTSALKLPVSAMLVGRKFDEATIYRAAYALEQAGNWMEW